MSVGVAVGVSLDVSVGGLPWYAVVSVVEIAVEIAMTSAICPYGVPLLAAAFRGSPWSARGRSPQTRGVSAVVVETP